MFWRKNIFLYKIKSDVNHVQAKIDDLLNKGLVIGLLLTFIFGIVLSLFVKKLDLFNIVVYHLAFFGLYSILWFLFAGANVEAAKLGGLEN